MQFKIANIQARSLHGKIIHICSVHVSLTAQASGGKLCNTIEDSYSSVAA
ncbi:hypothetical protein [Gloeocapsopsis sp. IPPAS B-1203]|nr:hypothetical protein [Gloeocapsopsis sp. IPPAS B-1203]